MTGEPLGEPGNDTVTLERPAYFYRPDGAVAHVKPGSYHVGLGPDGHLLLGAAQTPGHQGVVLRAHRTWHALKLTAPLAMSIPANHDRHHIVLLLPGGAALQSTGSLRPSGEPAATRTSVTHQDLAQALITRFPWPATKVRQPFNAATVIAGPGMGPKGAPWGTIEPGSNPTTFIPGHEPPNWISATVTACTAVDMRLCPALGKLEARNPTPSFPQLVSTTPVTVKSMLTWAGQTVELIVTSQVVNTGQEERDMTWTDLYRQVPSTNGPLTFPGVIVATGTPPAEAGPVNDPLWEQEAAKDFIPNSPSDRGAPIEFELRVNGITQAFRSCEYLVHGYGTGGVLSPPELRCS